MVLYVEVLAIGPFKRKLVSHYEYASDRYESTRESAPIVTRLFGIEEGNRVGGDVAAALGVSDIWDFNQHRIDTAKIDFVALRSAVAGLPYGKDVEALQAFSSEGYDLYFLPNG